MATTNRANDSPSSSGTDSELGSEMETDSCIGSSEEEDGKFFLSNMLEEDYLAIEEILSSDDEQKPKRIRSPNKERNFEEAHEKLMKDYFNGPESVYNEVDFERRFRISRKVFNHLHDKLMGTDPFLHKQDCFGNYGIHPLVKLVACLRYVAYGDAFDREDENLRLSNTSLFILVPKFCNLIIKEFGGQYLNRCPNEAERATINQVMGRRGFPGCLGSWDCKHFVWKNCPMRLAGQHKGHHDGGRKTLILEAVADHRRYLWQVNFGDPGCLNDINILDKSSIMGSLLTSNLSIKTEPYTINGRVRDWMYFLVDGIYPEWSIFVSSYTNPIDPKKRAFAAFQEKVRKDVECAFGILVQRFHVLQRPLRSWYQEDIVRLLHTCVILHNMVTEERSVAVNSEGEEPVVETIGGRFALFGRSQITEFEAYNERLDLFACRLSAFEAAVESSTEHYCLKTDLVEHIATNFAE
jgi:Plant transposon protein